MGISLVTEVIHVEVIVPVRQAAGFSTALREDTQELKIKTKPRAGCSEIPQILMECRLSESSRINAGKSELGNQQGRWEKERRQERVVLGVE